MEKIYEIVKIKQVVKEAELNQVNVIRSPEDGADVSRNYIGDDDREVSIVIYRLNLADFLYLAQVKACFLHVDHNGNLGCNMVQYSYFQNYL